MRWVLLAATIPIAIIANAGRVTITGILSEINPELAHGFFHELEGWVIFVIAVSCCRLHGAIRPSARAASAERSPETCQEAPVFDFLNSKAALAVTVLLLAQAAVLYSSGPARSGSGQPAAVAVAADAGLLALRCRMASSTRKPGTSSKPTICCFASYRDDSTGSQRARLFVAAFRSQRNGKSPHSPKNCLPGSGWTQLSSDMYSDRRRQAQPIIVNRYVVQHGDERSLVLYWYQSRDRVVASEYTAKFWVMADAMRLNRTDTALVRVVVPIANGDVDTATREAATFVKGFFSPLRRILPAASEQPLVRLARGTKAPLGPSRVSWPAAARTVPAPAVPGGGAA